MKAKFAAVLTVFASVFAGLVAMPVRASATVLLVGGTTGSLGRLLSPQGSVGSAEDLLAGAFLGQEVKLVDYPSSLWPVTGALDLPFGASVAVGEAYLEAAVRAGTYSTDIVGISQGAVVVQHAALALNADPNIPSETTFVMIANPNLGLFSGRYGSCLPFFGYIPLPIGETRFHTVTIVNEYDGWADPIARPWNLAAVANAFMAIVFVHPFAQLSDLATVPQENVLTTTNSQGGTLTSYFVPTLQLPLTTPLRLLGVPTAVVDGLDAALRPVIDSAYDRIPQERSQAPGLAVRPLVRPETNSTDGLMLYPKNSSSSLKRLANTSSGVALTSGDVALRRGSSSRRGATETSGPHSPMR